MQSMKVDLKKMKTGISDTLTNIAPGQKQNMNSTFTRGFNNSNLSNSPPPTNGPKTQIAP